MLNNIRNFSKTIFAKILLVIIIVPFVFWGMGGVFKGGNTNNIVKINNHNISTQDFINYINNQNLDQKVIKENIDKNVIEEILSELISKTMINMEIKSLDISISDQVLSRRIKKNKNFHDDKGVFSRIKYEKFLLLKNLTAPMFEKQLKEDALRKSLFAYISGGIKSPFFVINNIYKEKTSKLKIEFINLEKTYQSIYKISDSEIKKFVNDNSDELKEEYIDFTYVKITPNDLTGSEDFSELFFKKLDEIENKILNDVSLNDIIDELKIPRIEEKNYIINDKNNEIKKFIYKNRFSKKVELIDKNKFYLLYKINKINKILPNISNQKFKNKISGIIYKKNRFEKNKKLLLKINNKKFNETTFQNLAKNNSIKIEESTLNSIKDNSKFNLNSVKILYSLALNNFTLISDDKNNIYLAKPTKLYEKNISLNSDNFTNYFNEANIEMRNNIYFSYDFFLNDKYKIKINESTLSRVKNYFR